MSVFAKGGQCSEYVQFISTTAEVIVHYVDRDAETPIVLEA